MMGNDIRAVQSADGSGMEFDGQMDEFFVFFASLTMLLRNGLPMEGREGNDERE
jgi:hypothetical protein